MQSIVYTKEGKITTTDNGYSLDNFYRFKMFNVDGDKFVFELKSLGEADDDSLTVHGKENAEAVCKQLQSIYGQ